MSTCNLRTLNIAFQTSLVYVLLATVGCGGATDGVKLVSVKGTVTVGGSEPFANGMVRFTPPAGATTTASFAKTDEKGNFELVNQSQRKGAQPGQYNVSFSLIKQRDGNPLPPPDPNAKEENLPPEQRPVEFVPFDYSKIDSTKTPANITKSEDAFKFDIPKLKTVDEATAPPAAPVAPVGGRRRRDE